MNTKNFVVGDNVKVTGQFGTLDGIVSFVTKSGNRVNVRTVEYGVIMSFPARIEHAS